MDAFTPAQTTELVSRIGAKKARMRIDKMFINSFMGGALISFGTYWGSTFLPNQECLKRSYS